MEEKMDPLPNSMEIFGNEMPGEPKRLRRARSKPAFYSGENDAEILPTEITLQRFYRQLIKQVISRPNIATCLSLSLSHHDYENEFEKFLDFVKESEEPFGSHLATAIYPIFVYCYMSLIYDMDLAHAFFRKYVHVFDTTEGYDEVLEELYEVRTAKEFKKHPYFQKFRTMRYILRLPGDVLKKLHKFLKTIQSKALWQILSFFFHFQDPNLKPLFSAIKKQSRSSSHDESQEESVECNKVHDDQPLELLLDRFLKKDFVYNYPILRTYFECFEHDVYSFDCNQDDTELCITTGEPHIVVFPLEENDIDLIDEEMNVEEMSSPRRLAEAKSNPLIQLAEAEPMYKKIHLPAPVYTAKYFPKQPHLLLAASGTEMMMVNTLSETMTSFSHGHSSVTWDIDFNSTGSLFCSASHDMTCRLWDCNKSSVVRIFEGHKNIVTAVKFHPSGRYLISGSKDYDVRLWDVETSKCVRLLFDHEAPIALLACSPNKRIAASADTAGNLKVWDMEMNASICDLHSSKRKGAVRINTTAKKTKVVADGTVNTAMCFHGDHYFVLGNNNGLIQIWDFRYRGSVVHEEKVKEYMPVSIKTKAPGILHILLKKKGLNEGLLLEKEIRSK